MGRHHVSSSFPANGGRHTNCFKASPPLLTEQGTCPLYPHKERSLENLLCKLELAGCSRVLLHLHTFRSIEILAFPNAALRASFDFCGFKVIEPSLVE